MVAALLLVIGVVGAALGTVLAVVLKLVNCIRIASMFHQRQMRTLRASVVILAVTVADGVPQPGLRFKTA